MTIIESPADFERLVWPGQPLPGHEGLRLDFKRELDGQREAAIDVASFANGEGGTILYGVAEGPGPDGYKVATGLQRIDIDKTKEQLDQAIDAWLTGVDLRPESFPLATGGQSVLVVRVRPSARLVVVKAEHARLEGLVFAGRQNHGKYYMGVDEVERRFQSYAARSMRIRMQEFLDYRTGGHGPGQPIVIRVYQGRRLKEPGDQHQNLLPKEWEAGATLVAAGEWAARVHLHRRAGEDVDHIELPYDLISRAWWQPTPDIPSPGRPALLLAAYLSRNHGVVEVLPLLQA